jgi:hypothetical protein
MCDDLQFFNKEDYSRVLNNHNGRELSNAQCIKILRDHGATYGQAKNGAYTFLHHGAHTTPHYRGSQIEYDRILNEVHGHLMSNMECIKHLESLDYSQGQAKNAVYNYRKKNGLVR